MDTKTSGDTRSGYEWIALSVTTIGALMAAINASAVIIALPTIMADLQADFITIKWMLLSYMLILAALVPVSAGWPTCWGARTSTTWALSSSSLGPCCADCASAAPWSVAVEAPHSPSVSVQSGVVRMLILERPITRRDYHVS
ncbi:MAG: hypothetical protein ACXW1E_02845 [Halobacteriota archaeon]